jgi:hypothetical protein
MEAAIGLVGVVVGAVIAGGTQVLLIRRRERSEALVAARLVEADIQSIKRSVGIALDAERWTGSLSLPLESWAEYRGVLARELSAPAWDAVAFAFELLSAVEHTLEVFGGTPKGQTAIMKAHSHEGWHGLLEDLEAAADALRGVVKRKARSPGATPAALATPDSSG